MAVRLKRNVAMVFNLRLLTIALTQRLCRHNACADSAARHRRDEHDRIAIRQCLCPLAKL